MNHRTAARTVAAVLAADAVVHLYWTTGLTWPAPDTATLSRLVLNADVPFTPRILVPLAALLLTAAALVLARGGRLDALARRLPAPLLHWGPYAVAVGLLLRGLAGLVWITGLGTDPGDLFYWLNLALYTPLCLACAAATWAVARSHRRLPAAPAR
ncbi:DUF3995 domain-containing protein [Kitasatospora sp. NPDC054939]